MFLDKDCWNLWFLSAVGIVLVKELLHIFCNYLAHIFTQYLFKRYEYNFLNFTVTSPIASFKCSNLTLDLIKSFVSRTIEAPLIFKFVGIVKTYILWFIKEFVCLSSRKYVPWFLNVQIILSKIYFRKISHVMVQVPCTTGME